MQRFHICSQLPEDTFEHLARHPQTGVGPEIGKPEKGKTAIFLHSGRFFTRRVILTVDVTSIVQRRTNHGVPPPRLRTLTLHVFLNKREIVDARPGTGFSLSHTHIHGLTSPQMSVNKAV